MNTPGSSGRVYILVAGDILVMGLVTLFGFYSHGTLASAGLRIFSTFIPLTISWFLVAPFMGCYNPIMWGDYKQVWRPLYAVVIASPLAAWMRGFWLQTPIQPLFVLIIGAVAGLGMLAWRLVYAFLSSRSLSGEENHG